MWSKPLPNVDLDNRPLFEAYRDHDFVLYRCQECGDWYWPKAFCRDHHHNEAYFDNIELEPASGRGEVFSTAVTRRLFHEGFKDDLPYTFALIKLDEGPMFGSQLLDIDADDVHIGLPVEVDFRDVPADDIPEDKRDGFALSEGFTLPYFAPVSGGDSP